MNLKQIKERLDTLYYVTRNVSSEEEKGGLFIFFSQYKSILGQCNKVYPKERTIKKMLLNTFHIRNMLSHTKGSEAQDALQSEIQALIGHVIRIEQAREQPPVHQPLTDKISGEGRPENYY